jgi:hypothetical protein
MTDVEARSTGTRKHWASELCLTPHISGRKWIAEESPTGLVPFLGQDLSIIFIWPNPSGVGDVYTERGKSIPQFVKNKIKPILNEQIQSIVWHRISLRPLDNVVRQEVTSRYSFEPISDILFQVFQRILVADLEIRYLHQVCDVQQAVCAFRTIAELFLAKVQREDMMQVRVIG